MDIYKSRIFISHKGQRKSMKIGNKKTADAVAKQLRANLMTNENVFESHQSMKSFSQVAKIWIEVTVLATCKESAADEYEKILDNHVLPIFGKLRVYEISEGTIKNFIY